MDNSTLLQDRERERMKKIMRSQLKLHFKKQGELQVEQEKKKTQRNRRTASLASLPDNYDRN